jgi:transposase
LHWDVADGQIPISAVLTGAKVQRVRAGESFVVPKNLSRQFSLAEKERYKERTMVERANARLKDEFGGREIRVRGAAKVMAHLMFGVLALTVDQILKLVR